VRQGVRRRKKEGEGKTAARAISDGVSNLSFIIEPHSPFAPQTPALGPRAVPTPYDNTRSSPASPTVEMVNKGMGE